MVSHTVIDLNGIVRHYYDAHDAADVARAEKQFCTRAREHARILWWSRVIAADVSRWRDRSISPQKSTPMPPGLDGSWRKKRAART
jgi:hypothetical protein